MSAPPAFNQATVEPVAPQKSASVFQLRLRRFCRLKRGYFSFLILVAAYAGSFFLPFVMNNRAIVVHNENGWYFPSLRAYLYDTFNFGSELVYSDATFEPSNPNASKTGEANYLALQQRYRDEKSSNFVWMPFFPYGPNESFFTKDGDQRPPYAPNKAHWMGTDDRARDVMVRLAYGFRISISFALIVTVLSIGLGTAAGSLMGYYGRLPDLVGSRLVEIWSAVPFLYTVLIVASVFQPNFIWLVLILTAFGWMSISYYIRGEYYREKSKEYVAAARSIGEGDLSIIFGQILPNALTPIIAFAPFMVVGEIGALVALDYLGYGLPAPTPSWGELIGQGSSGSYRDWHLIVFPLLAMFVTLQLIVFIGESVREAFDPKVFSRLR